jgi:GTP-binding protein HflX
MSTGFDRDAQDFARGARAIVVLPDTGHATRDADARLAETAGLALAIGRSFTNTPCACVRPSLRR